MIATAPPGCTRPFSTPHSSLVGRMLDSITAAGCRRLRRAGAAAVQRVALVGTLPACRRSRSPKSRRNARPCHGGKGGRWRERRCRRQDGISDLETLDTGTDSVNNTTPGGWGSSRSHVPARRVALSVSFSSFSWNEAASVIHAPAGLPIHQSTRYDVWTVGDRVPYPISPIR
jgi:hypothetical protein